MNLTLAMGVSPETFGYGQVGFLKHDDNIPKTLAQVIAIIRATAKATDRVTPLPQT
jgi:hypothetical protein